MILICKFSAMASSTLRSQLPCVLSSLVDKSAKGGQAADSVLAAVVQTGAVAVRENALHEDFRSLYSNHHSWLRDWLRRRIGSSFDAADLAQDTFLSVMTSGTVAEIREPRPFLATIAGRLVAHRRRRLRLEEAYLEELAALPQDLAPSPEARLIALELLQLVDRALDGLPLRAKQAFLLTHLDGLSYAEIAERLEVSASSVKQYLMRANRQCLFGLSV
jgi:RNA polymerase sigma factor (sigma-70 family)